MKQPLNHSPQKKAVEAQPLREPQLPAEDNSAAEDLNCDDEHFEGLKSESQKLSDRGHLLTVEETTLTPQEAAAIPAVPTDSYYPDARNSAALEQDNVKKVKWEDLNPYGDNILEIDLSAETPDALDDDKSALWPQTIADLSYYGHPSNVDCNTEKLTISIAPPETDREDVGAANLDFPPL